MTVISYEKIISEHTWIVEQRQHCILSPDSDGFICGLFMTVLLNWEVSGFYDGKILLIRNGLSPEQCIFLDMDVNRPDIRSMGHHMVLYNKRITHPNFTYQNCIQPNLLRLFDGKKDFQRKYPFGTSHLLLGILQHARVIKSLPKEAIWPLLFTDGIWNNLFGYTENCLDWINFLQISTQSSHILHYCFCSNPYNIYQIMTGINDFLRLRDSFNAKGSYENREYKKRKTTRTGDKLRISDSKGRNINLLNTGNLYQIHEHEKRRIVDFIMKLAEYFELKYIKELWPWDTFSLIKMVKGDFSKSKLNNRTFLLLMERNPFSLAMTSGGNIEYTLFPSS